MDIRRIFTDLLILVWIKGTQNSQQLNGFFAKRPGLFRLYYTREYGKEMGVFEIRVYNVTRVSGQLTKSA